MQIILIEPFFTGSHKSWCKEYRSHSEHDVQLLTLGGHHWKWRMHGAAVTLARRYMAEGFSPDLIIASDMLDLTTFLALTRPATSEVPVALYFHENQLTYPWSPEDEDPGQKRDLHYGFINYSSALAADHCLFNSDYHRKSFVDSLPQFLRSFPDNNELNSIDIIAAKSQTLHLALDLKRLDGYQPTSKTETNRSPLILWNHRWEYDKNPQEFFDLLFQLQDEGYDFEVAIVGESFGERSDLFLAAKERLGDRVVQFGYAASFTDYAELLWRADIMPVHSVHDFFGVSVVQAIYCGCKPLLPKRLAYPEHLPEAEHHRFFYNDYEDMLARMRQELTLIGQQSREEPLRDELSGFVASYDWSIMVQRYDQLFLALTEDISD